MQQRNLLLFIPRHARARESSSDVGTKTRLMQKKKTQTIGLLNLLLGASQTLGPVFTSTFRRFFLEFRAFRIVRPDSSALFRSFVKIEQSVQRELILIIHRLSGNEFRSLSEFCNELSGDSRRD